MLNRNVLALFILYMCVCNYVYSAKFWEPVPNGEYISDEKVLIVPESERNLNFIIIGLWPISEKYPFLPQIKKPKNISYKEMIELEKLIYWLNFEITRGNIIRKIPSYTKIFVALPKSIGNLEKNFFLEYLKIKCGFTDRDIKERIYFFNTNTNLHWAQDTCEIIGRDEKGRTLIGLSDIDWVKYVSTIKMMVKKYNKFFNIKWFENNASAEGGDLEIVSMPDGKSAMFIGHHRVMRYIELQYNISKESKEGYEQWMIEEARVAFSNSVYGLPVHIIPEKLLYNKTKGTSEIFHLDMSLVVLPHAQKSKAFVPIYDKNDIVDILSRELLDKEFIIKCNETYNEIASQMKELGFDVIRIPFYDHPVRSPVNIVKFRNKDTGKITIFLGKFPYHLSKNNLLSPQERIQQMLYYLEENLFIWQETANRNIYNNILNCINNLFLLMAEEEKTPNPIAEQYASIYKKYGYDVVLVQNYAWGAGGLHCSLLY